MIVPEGFIEETYELLLSRYKGRIRKEYAFAISEVLLSSCCWNVECSNDYGEGQPNIWSRVILPSGEIKSLPINQIVRPVMKFIENNFQAIRELFFGEVKRKENYNEIDERKYIEAWSQPGALTGGLNWYRAPVTNFYSEIKVPTLVIHSMNDRFFTNKILDGLSDYVEDLKIVRIENENHWIKIDAPEVLVSNIKEFIG